MKKRIWISALLICLLLLGSCGKKPAELPRNSLTMEDLSYELIHTDRYVYAKVENKGEEILPELYLQAVFTDGAGNPIYYRDHHLANLQPGIAEYAEFYIETDEFDEPCPYENVKLLLFPDQYAFIDESHIDAIEIEHHLSTTTNELILHCTNTLEKELDSVELIGLFYHKDGTLCKVNNAYFGPLRSNAQGQYTSIEVPFDWDPENGSYEVAVVEATVYAEEPESCE